MSETFSEWPCNEAEVKSCPAGRGKLGTMAPSRPGSATPIKTVAGICWMMSKLFLTSGAQGRLSSSSWLLQRYSCGMGGPIGSGGLVIIIPAKRSVNFEKQYRLNLTNLYRLLGEEPPSYLLYLYSGIGFPAMGGPCGAATKLIFNQVYMQFSVG